LHEALLLLFRNRPALAAELLRDALQMKLPRYTEARIDSADLTDIQPAAYRADLVVLLVEQAAVLGIVVEAQLSPKEDKRFAWPAYVANLRPRLKCPVCLLVVTADEAVARWAAKPIDIGAGNVFTPMVLRPSGVPEVMNAVTAQSDPELAVLSAMSHGQDRDIHKAAQIALAAQLASLGLDEDRSRLYFDLVLASLSEAARRELQTMDPAKYEYQSDFAKRYVAQGRAEGRAALIVKLLTARFGQLDEQARARIEQASIEELDAIGERLLAARTLKDALTESPL
jgi:hypothetical protein